MPSYWNTDTQREHDARMDQSKTVELFHERSQSYMMVSGRRWRRRGNVGPRGCIALLLLPAEDRCTVLDLNSGVIIVLLQELQLAATHT